MAAIVFECYCRKSHVPGRTLLNADIQERPHPKINIRNILFWFSGILSRLKVHSLIMDSKEWVRNYSSSSTLRWLDEISNWSEDKSDIYGWWPADYLPRCTSPLRPHCKALASMVGGLTRVFARDTGLCLQGDWSARSWYLHEGFSNTGDLESCLCLCTTGNKVARTSNQHYCY